LFLTNKLSKNTFFRGTCAGTSQVQGRRESVGSDLSWTSWMLSFSLDVLLLFKMLMMIVMSIQTNTHNKQQQVTSINFALPNFCCLIDGNKRTNGGWIDDGKDQKNDEEFYIL